MDAFNKTCAIFNRGALLLSSEVGFKILAKVFAFIGWRLFSSAISEIVKNCKINSEESAQNYQYLK